MYSHTKPKWREKALRKKTKIARHLARKIYCSERLLVESLEG